MLVKCIDNSDVDGLTRGQVYEVLVKEDRYSTAYCLRDDSGELNHFFKERFEVVEGEVEEVKTEMTMKELIIAFLNGELKEGQVCESRSNTHNIMVFEGELQWSDHQNVYILTSHLDSKWTLRQEWTPCTWVEAAKAKAEGKIVKCIVDSKIERFYEDNIFFKDQNQSWVSIYEIRTGQWYIKGE